MDMQQALHTIRPLGDPLRTLRRFLSRVLIFGTVTSFVVIGISWWISNEETARFHEALERSKDFEFPSYSESQISSFDDIAGPAAIIALLGFGPTLIVMLIILPSRVTNAIYLRSFRHDPQTGSIRVTMANVLGRGFRVSGIRDPRRRTSWLHYIGLAFFVLRYIMPKYMNLEAGGDWKQRLWRSMADARCVMIDLTDLTPSVIEEIKLAITAIGPQRILFIVDESKSLDEWRTEIQSHLSSAIPPEQLHVAVWKPNGWWPHPDFVAATQAFRNQLPAGNAELAPASLSLATVQHEVTDTAYVHDWSFIWKSLLVALAANAVGLLLSLFSPSLANLVGIVVSIVLYSVLSWMFLSYLVECGSNWRRFSILTPILLLIGYYSMILSAVDAARESARNQICKNNLRQLGLAMMSYDDRYNSLPRAAVGTDGTKPLYSGRLMLLQYLYEPTLQSLYDRFDQSRSWDDPANAEVVANDISSFVCPSNSKHQPAETDYFFPVGKDYAYEPGPGRRGLSRAAMLDGASNTAAMIESPNQGINWAEPRDAEVDLTKFKPGHGQRANVLMADGSVRSVSKDMDPKLLRAALTRDGREIEQLPDY